MCRVCSLIVSATLELVKQMHIRGPYGNLKDRYVQSYMGVPFVYVKSQSLLWGEDPKTSSCQYMDNRSHQESRSPTKELQIKIISLIGHWVL